MTQSSLDPRRGQYLDTDSNTSDNSVIDASRALVVGRSQINRVVVSKILEKSGLRPLSLDPEAALKALGAPLPGTIVLDGGADNRDCDALIPLLTQIRTGLGGNAPRVLLLSTRVASDEALAALPVVDAVVAKPITPERLQSVLDRLRD